MFKIASLSILELVSAQIMINHHIAYSAKVNKMPQRSMFDMQNVGLVPSYKGCIGWMIPLLDFIEF